MTDAINANNAAAVNASNSAYSQMTLDELMTVVMAERTGILDQQVRDRIAELDAKNKELQSLNSAVAGVSNASTELENPDDSSSIDGDTNALIQKYAPDHYNSDGEYSKEDFDMINETMKTAADNLSSTSQMDMTKLQSTMNKYNQSFEMLSNFISKYAQSLGSVIANIR